VQTGSWGKRNPVDYMNEYSGYGDNDNYKAYIFPPGKLRLNWILNAHTIYSFTLYNMGLEETIVTLVISIENVCQAPATIYII